MFTLSGVSHFLFVPLALAVIYALLGSFILSVTFVPMMARMWLSGHHGGGHGSTAARSRNPLVRFQQAFECGFNRTREGYTTLLYYATAHSRTASCLPWCSSRSRWLPWR